MTKVRLENVDWRSVELRHCKSKKSYSKDTALKLARERTIELAPQVISAYRCSFCRRWHIGHTPSIESMQVLAAAIRLRAQEAPSEEDCTV